MRDTTHKHRCMRCGEEFYCLAPSHCVAAEAVMPKVVVQGPNGPQLFEHVCKRKGEHE